MFSRAVGREEHCKQISLACVESVCSVPDALGLPPAHGVCAFVVYTFQALGCSSRNCLRLAQGDVHVPGLSHSGSGSRVLHKGTDSVGCAFRPFPGLSSLGDQVLGECTVPGGLCILITSLVPATQFQFLGYSTRGQTQLGMCFVPFPGPSNSGDQVLCECTVPEGLAS